MHVPKRTGGVVIIAIVAIIATVISVILIIHEHTLPLSVVLQGCERMMFSSKKADLKELLLAGNQRSNLKRKLARGALRAK